MLMIDACNRQIDKEAVGWPEERSQVGRWMWGRARRVDPDPVGSGPESKISILSGPGPGPKILDPTGSNVGAMSVGGNTFRC
jgi:hypothetical protein